MLMRRKEAKSYGTKKLIEGHFKPGDKCLIIEDVITSGSSVLETAKDLREQGLVANKVIVVVDRQQGGEANLNNNNVQVKSLFTVTTIIEILLKNNKITQEVAENVKSYFAKVHTPVAGMRVSNYPF